MNIPNKLINIQKVIGKTSINSQEHFFKKTFAKRGDKPINVDRQALKRAELNLENHHKTYSKY